MAELKIKSKKCRVCQDEFKPFQTTQVVCGPRCAIVLAESKSREKYAKENRQAKVKLKTRSELLKEAQSVINSYVRARDKGLPCISCGCMETDKGVGGHFDAGHYRSRGSAPHLRFNTLNIFGQCKRCNRYLSGNYSEFRKGLIKRKGKEYVEYIENLYYSKKFTVEYLKRLKKVINKKTRIMLKRRS